MKNKSPKLHHHILVDGRIIGAILQDELGFFYRPKRKSIPKGRHSEKNFDGEYFDSVQACERNVIYGS